MENFNKLINSLDNNQAKDVAAIYIPSLNRPVNFKLLNAKQHKDIITSVMDQSMAGVSFSIIMLNILKDNSMEKIEFLTTDCPYIYTALRALSLSKELKVGDSTHNLDSFLANKSPLTDSLKERVIETIDHLKIVLSIPTVGKELMMNKESRRNVEDLTKDQAKKTLGELYTNEFIKHIKKIEFDFDGKATDVEFGELSIIQKKQVVDKLPLSVAEKMIQYINELKAESNKFFVENRQKVEVSIDQAFFTV